MEAGSRSMGCKLWQVSSICISGAALQLLTHSVESQCRLAVPV